VFDCVASYYIVLVFGCSGVRICSKVGCSDGFVASMKGFFVGVLDRLFIRVLVFCVISLLVVRFYGCRLCLKYVLMWL